MRLQYNSYYSISQVRQQIDYKCKEVKIKVLITNLAFFLQFKPRSYNKKYNYIEDSLKYQVRSVDKIETGVQLYIEGFLYTKVKE